MDNGTRALVNPPVLFKFCRERGNGAQMNVIARLSVYIRYYYYYYYYPFVPLKNCLAENSRLEELVLITLF